MQLEKIVAYHKALADPTRIRLLALLSSGECSGLELAEKLGISPATVTFHAAKLRTASLIGERRDKNTIYFSLKEGWLRDGGEGSVRFILKPQSEGGVHSNMEQQQEQVRQAVLRNFMTAEGKLKHIPAQLKKKLIILEFLAGKLERGKSYTEKEINTFIRSFHEDFATIRREFIMHQYMFRDREVYELNPPELWAKWQTLS